jgi:hypothetical protein
MRPTLRPRPVHLAERLTGLLALLSSGMLAGAFGYALVCVVPTFEVYRCRYTSLTAPR